MFKILQNVLVVMAVITPNQALDNGLALTPPMGWLTWQRFRCTTDCNVYPDECISEKLIKRTVNLMVSKGYVGAGYEYVAIDDCWLLKERDSNGKMVADPERFPAGMKALADYIHRHGMKFGMYQDCGSKTCGGYPGVLKHEKNDIDTFVSWEIDYLKLDGCYIDATKMDEVYPAFGKMMNQTGRDILYSCSWPAYQEGNMKPNYSSIAEHCNLWRNYDDIEDSWDSLKEIMKWFGDNQDRLAEHAGPGHWNDPDMLLIGNFGLSLDQARVQMAVWSVLAAPLLMSVDLGTIRPEFEEILLNHDVIAINQDPLGKQGLRVWNKDNMNIWTRELLDGSYAIAFVNLRTDGMPKLVSYSQEQMKIKEQSYTVQDLYHEEDERSLDEGQDFQVKINPTGVKFYKFIPDKNKLIEGVARVSFKDDNNNK